MSVDDSIVVLCTFPSLDKAREIARVIVEKRLAACVNIVSGGVEPIYHWQDRIESDDEFLTLIKSTQACFEELKQTIVELHPHDVPEVIALPIIAGSETYLDWIQANVGSETS